MKTITKQLVDEAYVLMYVLVNTSGGDLALRAATRFLRRQRQWESVNEMYWDGRREAEDIAATRVKEWRDGRRQV